MTQDNANRDAVPAAIARTDAESDRTDKAAPRPGKGAGNTNARLAALEQLSALDQKLELEYGLVGNPMIKSQQRTPDQQTTPGECSTPRDGTSEPVAWWLRGTEYDTGCEYEYVSLLKENAEAAAAEGGTVVPLYRAPTLTDEEREAVKRAIKTLDGWQQTGGYHSAIEDDAATLRGLLERLR